MQYNEGYQQKYEKLESRITKAKPEPARQKQTRDDYLVWLDRFERYRDIEGLSREIIVTLIERIEVYLKGKNFTSSFCLGMWNKVHVLKGEENYMKKKGMYSRVVAVCMIGVMALSLTGCGKPDGEKTAEETKGATGGTAYVPEVTSLNDGSGGGYYVSQYFGGNYIYYLKNDNHEENPNGNPDFFRRELKADAQDEQLPIKPAENRKIIQPLPDREGNIILLLAESGSQEEPSGGILRPEYILAKYSPEGSLVFEESIDEAFKEDKSKNPVKYAAVDGEGRVYISSDTIIRLFDGEGSYQGEVDTGAWISSMGTGRDGLVYYSSFSKNSTDVELVQVDFDAKSSGIVYHNFQQPDNYRITPGKDSDFLIADETSLYGYDLETQSSEKVLDWLDSDINGAHVDSVTAMEDGRFMAYIWNRSTGSQEFVFLTAADANPAAEKTVLTLASLNEDQRLQEEVVEFNKNSDEYRIEVKYYMTGAARLSSFEDAVLQMNNDLLSDSGSPDIINLTSLDISQLASKGLLEDINLYFESSSKLKREDFVDNALESYTMGGILTCIPTGFTVTTIFARASEVGEDMGWTLEELLAYAEKYPEAKIMEGATSDSIINFCMVYNQEAFIDWDEAKCNFDTEEFRKVLEFAGQFPAKLSGADFDNEKTPYERYRDKDVLLHSSGVSMVEDIQAAEGLFGEPVTAIGFPTADGSAGAVLYGQGMYGILSKADNKEGAWQFIESVLSEGNKEEFGFSTRKSMLEKTLKESMEPKYVLDDNGEPLLDGNGEKILMTSNWSDKIELTGATQEQVDMLRELLAAARPARTSNRQLMNIIFEEAAPYFAGQKSIDDVIHIIQNRVQLYVNENS